MFAPCLIATLVFAAASADEPALRGLDPVSLCLGDETPGLAELTATHNRFTYRFASEESRARFLQQPQRWAIQWDGGCGRMGPLSGVGSPERWTVHDGRIYIFASDRCREGFLADPERHVVTPQEFSNSTAVERELGAAWIERTVEAHGGSEAIDAHSGLRMVLDGPSRENTIRARRRADWEHRLELVLARDGRVLRRSTWTPPDEGEVLDTTYVLAGSVFVRVRGDTADLTSAEACEDLLRYAQREPLTLLWGRKAKGFAAVHAGESTLGDAPVVDVVVRHAGLITTLHLDPETARIRGLSWRGRPSEGVTRHVVETFTDHRIVAGVLLPSARTVTADGEDKSGLAVAWETIELLREVSDEPFRR